MDTRVGGPSRGGRNPADRHLVTFKLLGAGERERERFFATHGLPSGNGLGTLDHIGREAVLSKLADSARRSYNSGWKQWAAFRVKFGLRSKVMKTG